MGPRNGRRMMSTTHSPLGMPPRSSSSLEARSTSA
ncbi:Uncharacterised protein [Mycobacteroides abscessus]|nr:Uncharacterised protein [Mycobacteroides abscessus]